MAKEENSSFSAASPDSGRTKAKKSIGNNNKNRVEFRVPNDEIWIHESIARLLFEQGHIPNPTVSETARFCLNLYATDYMAQGELLTKKLSGLIPVNYYDKLVRELESEKRLRMLYQKANETFDAWLKDHHQTIDNHATNVKDREEALKGQFLSIPGLRIGNTAADYVLGSENGQG